MATTLPFLILLLNDLFYFCSRLPNLWQRLLFVREPYFLLFIEFFHIFYFYLLVS